MAASGLVMHPSEADSYQSLYSIGMHGSAAPVEAIQIFLATLGSNRAVIPMRVLSSDTIASVKLRIQAYKGFYTNQQRLVYAGRELTRDDCLIKDYGVSNGEVIHLVLRLSDLVDVNVKTVSGREYLFRVGRSNSVRDLKQRISEKEGGLALNEQQLVFRGKQLDDQRRIDDLYLEDDAVVHLVVRRSVKVRSKSVGTDVELSIVASGFDVGQAKLPALEVSSYPAIDNGQVKLPTVSDAVVEDIDDSFSSEKVSKIWNDTRYLLEPANVPKRDMPDSFLDALHQAKAGLEEGHSPILSSEGSGGTYFLKDMFGSTSVGVFKPVDEEPMAANNPRGLTRSNSLEGLKRGVQVGEGAVRETAAFILDHPSLGPSGRRNEEGFAGVPPTMMIRCAHPVFNRSSELDDDVKLGSFQQFVHSFSNCEDMGPARFPVDEVHKISVLDMRLANLDRNGANILVCKTRGSTSFKLVPIDHGYCLPDKFEDCTFEWLYWPQARVPFSSFTLEYIAALDAEQDLAILSAHGLFLRKECARVLRVATMLLKKGAAAGFTPFTIGSMMCRECFNKKSAIEMILEEVEDNVLPSCTEGTYMDTVSEVMDRYLMSSGQL